MDCSVHNEHSAGAAHISANGRNDEIICMGNLCPARGKGMETGFVEDMNALGRKPAARVIGKEIVTADATVASQLALTKGQRVVRIRRVRLADGVPLSFDETYLPSDPAG